MKSDTPKSPNQVKMEIKVEIKNKLGLHARPAALFVQIAGKYKCDIFVRKGRQKVNGKSIMGLMMLAAEPGSNLGLEAMGIDASEALDELQKLVQNNFGE